MTDLILSSDVAAWLEIRTKTADDNIYSKGKKMFFSASTSSESVKCPERNVLSPARVTDSLSSYQIRPLHLPNWTYLLTAQFFFVSFTLSEKERSGERKELSWILSLLHLFISASLTPHSSCVSLTSVETLAALCWIFASNYLVGSTLTQLRLHISSSSSSASAFLSKSKTPSLTSTPTHLQNRFELQLCSDLSLALSTLFPPWLFSHIGADAGSAQIWSWVDSGHLHIDSKPAVHQLWLWLISALELQNQASSLSNPKCQQDVIFYLKSCLHS